MIIIKTPLRISFFGGGTDYPDWVSEYGGQVLSTTIDKYIYLTCRYLPPFFDHNYRISYSQIEHVKSIKNIKHPVIREAISYLKITKGLEIHSDADLPARTGLGSSSSFTVSLLHGLYTLLGKSIDPMQLAKEAIQVEQVLLKEPVGYQDQTIAAIGGLNHIQFQKDKTIQINPLTASTDRIQTLNQHLLLFYTGISRKASLIAKDQVQNLKQNTTQLHQMMQMVDEAVQILNSNQPITAFGKLLHETWQIKQSLSTKITNPMIQDLYTAALDSGGIGGKLLGAGGGGFMLIFAEPDNHKKIKDRLKDFLHIDFQFDTSGSQILFNT